LLAAAVAVSTVVIWNQQAVWRDDVTLLAQCAQIAPDSPIWHRMLATALDRQGDLARAEREFRTTLVLTPGDAAVLHKLATLDMRLGRIDEAVREADESIRLAPVPSPSQYILLAKLYDMQGSAAQSEAVLKRAESIAGAIPAVGVARAQTRMAHGDAPGAEQILLSITRDYPGDVLAWVQLGLVLAGEKQYARALAALQLAGRLSPDDSSIRVLSAEILLAMGRDSDAAALCRQVLASAPEDANALALLGQIEHRPPVR
jgi:predicted Zn-dependent protease